MKLRSAVTSIRLLAFMAVVAAIVWSLNSRTQATEPAAPPPFAVIDVNKVLSSSKAGKAAYDALKRMQDERMQKARDMDNEVRRLQAALDAGRTTMGETRVAEAARQIADKRVAMQRYATDAEREIGEARNRELGLLETRIRPVIEAISKEMGLALVFNKFESGLVYASDSVDITQTVITRFDAATP